MPGQANSYFYRYTKLIALRKEAETALEAEVQPAAVPHFRCMLNDPKTCKQLQNFRMQRFFREAGVGFNESISGNIEW